MEILRKTTRLIKELLTIQVGTESVTAVSRADCTSMPTLVVDSWLTSVIAPLTILLAPGPRLP